MMPDWTSSQWATFTVISAAVLCALTLIAAAAHDIIARTVPNWMSGLLVVAGLIARLAEGTLIYGAIAAALVFVCAAICWRCGWLGGGDVKLLGGTCLVVHPLSVMPFLVAMSFAGSALAVLYLIAGYLLRAYERRHGRKVLCAGPRPADFPHRIMRVELRRVRRGGPLPYACAIATGFLFIMI